jgi:hypothetical protein
MNWIVVGIKWIMVVSGILTATMIYAAIAPEAALQSTFGETLDDRLRKLLFATGVRSLHLSEECSSMGHSGRPCVHWY